MSRGRLVKYLRTNAQRNSRKQTPFLFTPIPTILKASNKNLIILEDFNRIIDPRDREGSNTKIDHQLKIRGSAVKSAIKFKI